MNLKETSNGVLITIFVKPNSPKFQVTLDGEEIIVQCTQEPEKGKVNKELIKEFTKIFHAKVTFVLGLTSRQKQLLIEGLTKTEAERLLTLASKDKKS